MDDVIEKTGYFWDGNIFFLFQGENGIKKTTFGIVFTVGERSQG